VWCHRNPLQLSELSDGKLRNLLADFGLRARESKEDMVNKFMAHIGVLFKYSPAPA
jgi:hypothetical protein